MPNIELIKQVRDAIKNEDNLFDMECWGVDLSPSGGWFRVDAGDVPTLCGTPACLAGWGVMLGSPQIGRLPSMADVRRPARAVPDLASDLMDVPFHLFHTMLWPTWARGLARDEGERAAAVALLDDIIRGLNPWGVSRGH